MTASELDVRNRNTTPTIGPSRNAVTLTSAVIANTRSSWRLITLAAAAERRRRAELLDHARLRGHGLPDEIEDRDRDADHGEREHARHDDDPQPRPPERDEVRHDSAVGGDGVGAVAAVDPVERLRRGAGDEHGGDDRRELAEQQRDRTGDDRVGGRLVDERAEAGVLEDDALDDRGDDAERDEDDADAEEERGIAPVEPPRRAVDLSARADLVDRQRLVRGPARPPAQPDAEQRDRRDDAQHEPRRAQEPQVDSRALRHRGAEERRRARPEASRQRDRGAAARATCRPPT